MTTPNDAQAIAKANLLRAMRSAAADIAAKTGAIKTPAEFKPMADEIFKFLKGNEFNE